MHHFTSVNGSKSNLLTTTNDTILTISSSDSAIICPPFLALNLLIDLSSVKTLKDDVKKRLLNFHGKNFNSKEIKVDGSEGFNQSNWENALLFHFEHTSIDQHDIYRKNYKFKVIIGTTFIINGNFRAREP